MVLKLTCPFYATFTLMTIFIARSGSLVSSDVLKYVCHVLMRSTFMNQKDLLQRKTDFSAMWK